MSDRLFSLIKVQRPGGARPARECPVGFRHFAGIGLLFFLMVLHTAAMQIN